MSADTTVLDLQFPSPEHSAQAPYLLLQPLQLSCFACVRPSRCDKLMAMQWFRTAAERRRPTSWEALCLRVFCVAFIYLAHTVLNGGGHACAFAASFADSLDSVPAAEEKGSIACGEACFDTDSILPRSQENDPFLAFRALVALMQPPVSVQQADNFRGGRPCPEDARHPVVLQPHLSILEHSSQILC